MTFQFRTRTRSIYDYGKDLKTVGKCCFSDGTSGNYTFVECFQKNGNFFPDETIACPQESVKGYCCSCLYTSEAIRNIFISTINSGNGIDHSSFQITDGIVENVTKCECDRIGGNWAETLPTPSHSLCKKNALVNGSNIPVDVRLPSACCYPFYGGLTFVNGITCTNVCNARQCANLASVEGGGGDVYMDSVFNQYKLCNKTFNNSGTPFQCSTQNTLSQMLQGSQIFADQEFGACYSLTSNNNIFEYSCSVTTNFSCDGYWIPPDSETGEISFCNHKFSPKTPIKSFDRINSIKYTEAEFESIGLNIGDEFQGGIYVGIFKPAKTNTTSASSVYGSLNFATPVSRIIGVSDESPYDKWAIIVNKNSIIANLFNVEEVTNPVVNFTSYYDGYMNIHGENIITPGLNTNTTNSIKGQNRNGFIDYYIPSIVEMMFFAEQFKNNLILQNTFNFTNNYFSSTIFTDKYSTQNPSNQNNFDGKRFIYGINFAQENYGKSVITNINTIVAMMLFRRIVII